MDTILERQTYILISDNIEVLYPSDDLFPSDRIYPASTTRIDNIVAGSMSISEILSESTIQFGQLYASKFECKIYKDEDAQDIGDLSGKYITVVQTEGNDYHIIFTGLVDSCKLDRLAFDRTIVAYDLAYKLGYINVADWWNNFWENKVEATIGQLRQSLLEYVNIEYIPATLVNDNVKVKKACNIKSISFCSMLKMICELGCCFPHFTRDGKLKFIVLNSQAGYNINNDEIEGENSDFEEYTSDPFTGIQFYTSGGTLRYTQGTDDCPYAISDNILIYDMEDTTYQTIGANMLDAIRMLVYRPSNVKMIISDWTYNVGDYIVTTKGFFYVFKMDFSGSQLIEQSMRAEGTKSQDEVGTDISTIETVMEDIVSNIDDELNDIYDEVDEVGDEVDQLISELDEVKRHIDASNDHLRITFAETTGQDIWFVNGVIHSQKYYEDVEKGIDPPDTSQDVLGLVERYNIQTQVIMDYGEPYARLEDVATSWSSQGYDIEEEVGAVPTAEDKDEHGDYIYDHTVPTDKDENDDKDNYYMVRGTGDIYQYQVIVQSHSSTKATGKKNKTPTAVFNMVKVADGVVESTEYGWDIFPSDAEIDDYYLDQETGKVYHLEGTEANKHWVYKWDCPTTKLVHETSMEQDAHNIVLEASARAGEDTLLSGRIQVSAHSITMSTSGQGQTSGITIQLMDELGRPIQGANITLTGLVEFQDLSGTGGSTFINGGNIQTQTIEVNTIKPNKTDPSGVGCIAFGDTGDMPISSMYVIGGSQWGDPFNGASCYLYEQANTLMLSSPLLLNDEPCTLILGYGTQSNTSTSSNNKMSVYGKHLGGSGSGYDYAHTDTKVRCRAPFYYDIFPYLRSSSTTANVRCRESDWEEINWNDPDSSGYNTYYMFAPLSQSSRRWKHDIRPIEDENLDPHKLYDLQVSQFIYNLDYLEEEDQRYNTPIPGFIAEDVAMIYPIAADISTKTGQASDWNVRYIVPPMLKLIQEQNDRITALEEEIKELKSMIKKED